MQHSQVNFGIHAATQGFSSYRRSSAGLAAARELGGALALGLRFNYHALKIAGYGKAMSMSADIAALFRLSSTVKFGLHLINPGRAGKENIPLPVICAVGLGYDPSDDLCFSIEMIKELSQPVNTRLSMQYKMRPELLMRTVFESGGSFWFGAGMMKGKMRVDVFSAYHLTLGVSMGMIVYWFWKKSKEGA